MAKTILQRPPAQLSPRPQDRLLTTDQFLQLEPFRKSGIKLEEFPGSVVLRHYRPGDVICLQGEYGFTGFYLVKRAELAAMFPEEFPARGESPEEAREVACALIMAADLQTSEPGRGSWWRRWRDKGTGGEPPRAIPIDGPEDIEAISGVGVAT